MKKLQYQTCFRGKILLSVLGMVFGFVVTLLAGVTTYADGTSYSTTAAVTVAASCTMEGTINTAHTASIANGAYTENIGKTTLSTSCNDPNGYAIYAIGYTGDSYTGTNHTKLIGANTNLTIDTGTYTAGTTTSSVWSMKLSPVTGSSAPTIENSYNNYNVVPDNFTKVASLSSATNPTLGSNLETTYAVYIGGNQAADTYTGQVKYVLVHPSTNTAGTYTIAYNANGGTGTMTSSTNIYNFEPLTLPDSTFTSPSGYQFAGWCAVKDTTANPQTACQGQFYEAGDSVTSLGSANTTVTLYAVWEKNYMQNLTSSLCTATPITAFDSRDGQAYTITRLEDGKCWMTTNLNLTGGTLLSPDDTDFEDTYTLPTTDGWSVSNGKLVLPASDNTGFGTDNYAYVYNSGNTTNTCSAPGCYSYYSWDAATLGSGRSIDTDNTDAPYSICPKGWRLPNTRTGTDSTSDFRALMIAYGGSDTIGTYNTSTAPTGATMFNNISASPAPNFLRGGRYNGGSFLNGGSNGYYWSATSGSSTTARSLNFSSSTVNSANNSARRNGFSVRCVLDELTMQDVATWGSTLSTGDEVTAIDTRDGKEYTVAKLADGNIWMTQNLDLDIDSTKTYTPADTNISANWTPSTATYATDDTTWEGLVDAPESYDPGDLCWNGTLDENFETTLDNGTTACTEQNKHYHIGNYYNWTAAAAMNDSSDYHTYQQDANQSICPAGWRLPIGGTTNTGSKSFQYLADQLSLTVGTSGNIQNSPVYFVYGGYWDGSSYGIGSDSYYWSSVVGGDDGAFNLGFNVGGYYLNPWDYEGRDFGYLVRCVAR